MQTRPKWLARTVLLLLIGLLASTIALASATGAGAVILPFLVQTASGTPSPTPYTSCSVAIPAGYPTPSPVCRTVTPSPEPSASASPSASPTEKPRKKKKPGAGESTITLAYRLKADTFTGLVDSRGKCEDLRRVVIYKDLKGKKDEVVGRDITDSDARFTVPTRNPAGNYYAKAPRSISIGYATQVDCEAIKSDVLTIAKPKPTS